VNIFSWFLEEIWSEIKSWLSLIVIVLIVGGVVYLYQSNNKPYVGRWEKKGLGPSSYLEFTSDGRYFEDTPLWKAEGTYVEESPGRLHIKYEGKWAFIPGSRVNCEVTGNTLKTINDDQSVDYLERVSTQHSSEPTPQAQLPPRTASVPEVQSTPDPPAAAGDSQQQWYSVTDIPSGDPGLNVHSGPGMSFPVIMQLPNGYNQIQITGSQMNGTTQWVHIIFQNHTGWVSKQYLQPE
jgi:Bacterial SH3 domain